MKRKIYLALFFALVMLMFTGCTSFTGICKADKPNTYYITTNKPKILGLFFNTPGVKFCVSNPETGDLKCIDVADEWEYEMSEMSWE